MPVLRVVHFTAVLALAALPPPASSVAREPSPELGRSFVVSLVSGTVLVKPGGSARFARLTGRRIIPVGSTVNATKGKVRVVGAVSRSRRDSGDFYGGAFTIAQARRSRALIDLELVGGSFAGCGKPAAADGGRKSRRVVRRLRGIARGRFRTRGRYSAATVRGTKWLIQDRCASTGIEAKRGRVEVTNGDVLSRGQAYEIACVPANMKRRRDYCINLFNDGEGLVNFGLETRVHQGDYTLCIQPPSGDPLCNVLGIPPLVDRGGYRRARAFCIPGSGKGTYTASWTVQGQLLGVLPFKVRRPEPGFGCPEPYPDCRDADGVRQTCPTTGAETTANGRARGAGNFGRSGRAAAAKRLGRGSASWTLGQGAVVWRANMTSRVSSMYDRATPRLSLTAPSPT